MSGQESLVINDNLFQKTISCPLKFFHLTEQNYKNNTAKFLFRRRNKLHVRNAIAQRYKNCKYTSNGVQDALKETESWLKEEMVAICGAVIQYKNQLTRIPILVKEGSAFTIVQVHGKLRKRSDDKEIQPTVTQRGILKYLLKAAYRLDVVAKYLSRHDVEVLFYFPDKHFKSSIDNLHLFAEKEPVKNQAVKEEFSKLFSKVKATVAVRKVHQKIPGSVAHQHFEGLSVSEAVEKMILFGKYSDLLNIERHSGCKFCEFRWPDQKNREDCWDRFFDTDGIKHPEKHIFELIGHGYNMQSENGKFYQEEAEPAESFPSFDSMQKYGGRTITILQRQNLQILQAKGEPVPELWVKRDIRSIDSLVYPLHFLDFEAATFALPMQSGLQPYSPVYFQFSCHTLKKSGEVVHTEWLDQQDGQVYPHMEFVNRLGEIPGFFQGTIMQYSPFEKQGVNRLVGEFKKDPIRYENQIHILEKIKKSELPDNKNRFFDMSKIIRDYYYNKFFNDGLGLKQVLVSILQWENQNGMFEIPNMKIGESSVDIVFSTKNSDVPDPYSEIQNPDFLIADGSAAMNAWLAVKNDLLTHEEKSQIFQILRKYCALDSFGLFIIYKHLERLSGKVKDEDLIKF